MVLQKFLGCIELEIGGYIIAGIGIFYGLYGLAQGSLGLLFLICILIDVLLIYGINKKNHSYILPSVIIHIISLGLNILYIILIGLSMEGALPVAIFMLFIIIIVGGYTVMVLYSLYVKIKNDPTNQQIPMYTVPVVVTQDGCTYPSAQFVPNSNQQQYNFPVPPQQPQSYAPQNMGMKSNEQNLYPQLQVFPNPPAYSEVVQHEHLNEKKENQN
ncbi:hypothetical protein PVAND_017340 [Polypedilum vanderplanki]|uniref:Uncharacterized protein n=1 Tax=Polypedilum vanderplanki TaxID=319348 RepID=A0A9J6BI01_POLVA|nr:hypothetical protein PVAND_017340 [Polypedilum vanderplanki]